MSHETREASLKVIGIGAGAIGFLVVATIVVSAWVYFARYHGAEAGPAAGRQSSFMHGPDEKRGIETDYRDVVREAEARLDHYAWVDRDHGVARIPIERAMQLLVAGAKPAPAPTEPGQVP